MPVDLIRDTLRKFEAHLDILRDREPMRDLDLETLRHAELEALEVIVADLKTLLAIRGEEP